jgi:anti-anti-sigma regulatory factor
MPTQITQIEDTERGKMILRVEGEMMREDAVLLERIALDMREQMGMNLTLDFADLDFMDSESAPVLKRLEREHGFEFEGMEFFLQNVINETENRKS